MIKIQRFTEPSSDTKERTNGLINDEFGDIPIVKKTSWASPGWTIINYFENEIVTSYNVVIREITIDNQDLKTAGINNVITQKNFVEEDFQLKLY